mmetsp:Transcript_14323/g.34158  ORF Transcript_14323/g.34158 Transcript_14323/m.34158 type:complete len:234 (-) Transcript_14323:1183-1884(-)
MIHKPKRDRNDRFEGKAQLGVFLGYDPSMKDGYRVYVPVNHDFLSIREGVVQGLPGDARVHLPMQLLQAVNPAHAGREATQPQETAKADGPPHDQAAQPMGAQQVDRSGAVEPAGRSGAEPPHAQECVQPSPVEEDLSRERDAAPMEQQDDTVDQWANWGIGPPQQPQQTATRHSTRVTKFPEGKYKDMWPIAVAMTPQNGSTSNQTGSGETWLCCLHWRVRRMMSSRRTLTR